MPLAFNEITCNCAASGEFGNLKGQIHGYMWKALMEEPSSCGVLMELYDTIIKKKYVALHPNCPMVQYLIRRGFIIVKAYDETRGIKFRITAITTDCEWSLSQDVIEFCACRLQS
jgi:hypothetical protein